MRDKLKIEDKRIALNHSWRHTFETVHRNEMGVGDARGNREPHHWSQSGCRIRAALWDFRDTARPD